jgi:hypothetical protein
MVTVDVLSPGRKPSDGVIMNDLFPLARKIGNWNRHVFSYVDDDILRIHTQLGRIQQTKSD